MDKCRVCGMVTTPDSIKCPGCGVGYDSVPIVKPAEVKGNGHTGGSRPRYTLRCSIHGVISVRGYIYTPPVRCPFC